MPKTQGASPALLVSLSERFRIFLVPHHMRMHLPSSVRRQLAPEAGESDPTGEGWDLWLQKTTKQGAQNSTQFSGSATRSARSRRRGGAKASTHLRRRPEVAWCGQYAPRTASWPIYSCSFLRLQRDGDTCTVDLKSHDSRNRSRRNRCVTDSAGFEA